MELDLRIQQALMKQVPEITGVVARVGADEIGLDPMGLNQTDTFLVLKPRAQWSVARSGPKTFTARSPRTPMIISDTRMSIGCVKL